MEPGSVAEARKSNTSYAAQSYKTADFDKIMNWTMTAAPANSSSSRTTNAAMKSHFNRLKDATQLDPAKVSPTPLPVKTSLGRELWLWKLKADRPDLFSKANEDAANRKDIPAGFVEHSEGLYWNQAEETMWHKESNKYFGYDAANSAHYEINEGVSHEDELAVFAAGNYATAAVGKRVIIQDLHKAAQVCQTKLGHFDRPSAMLALLSGDDSHTGSAVKNLHMMLLQRLGSYRGAWSGEMVSGAISRVFAELQQGANGGNVSIAMALICGKRLFVATTRGMRCIVCTQKLGVDVIADDRGETDDRVATRCFTQESGFQRVGLIGSTCPNSTLPDEEVADLMRQPVTDRRPRPGAIAIAERVHERGCRGAQLALATVHWKLQQAEMEPSAAMPAAKRPRTEAASQVRARHILLMHVGEKRQLQDPVRRRTVTRSMEEAEGLLLKVLAQVLDAAGTQASKRERHMALKFTALCREQSECASSLKGSDLAGDLGWLTKQERKLPAPLVKAAFELEVGQLSDIVPSERGLHLLLRTA